MFLSTTTTNDGTVIFEAAIMMGMNFLLTEQLYSRRFWWIFLKLLVGIKLIWLSKKTESFTCRNQLQNHSVFKHVFVEKIAFN